MERLGELERLTVEIKALKENLKANIDKVLLRRVEEESEIPEETKEESEIAEAKKKDDDLVLSLEEEMDRKEEEMLAASCTLVEIFRELDCSFNGAERRMGRLSTHELIEACVRYKDLAKLIETDIVSVQRATSIRNFWQPKISALFHADQEADQNQRDLVLLKARAGEEVYWLVRKGFREARVASRMGCYKKPWNLDGEATLTELLDALPLIVRRRHTRPRRDS
ncbi:LOW QUALITY PROTEIN: uncharacterized protein LOC17883555 [Capsella rubella]|uniref:LOW QUALITY PROTEIN: uncharacterized protein LOC17883555 n=1 Tax=Capsella rubella TaxID=81985 RepID=UPI000CD4F5C7|nr:LOW QUALITY PROTEIN: uncharacterized protein LOC17883555 [Capsella rubella]